MNLLLRVKDREKHLNGAQQLPTLLTKSRMIALIKYRRIRLLLPIVLVGFVAAWIYWSQPHRADLATFAPSDCLAFVEADRGRPDSNDSSACNSRH